MGIAEARPGLVLACAAVAAGIAVPVAVWRWMVHHTAFFGNISLGVPGAGSVQVDGKWAYLILGLVVVIGYSAVAGIALVLSRRARRPFRNAITLVMLPVFFALAWIVARSPR